MATPELVNMLAGDESYADVLERFWDAEGVGSVSNPEFGRSFMMSYLPAGGGSYRSASYNTFSEAKRAMEARMGRGTQRIEILDTRGNRPSKVLVWTPSTGIQSMNPIPGVTLRKYHQTGVTLPQAKRWKKIGKWEIGTYQLHDIGRRMYVTDGWVVDYPTDYGGGKVAYDSPERIPQSVKAAVAEYMKTMGVQSMNPFGGYRGKKTGDILDAIHVGDKVVVVNRFGQERSGRAVMRGPHGWVLNMGGAHGTPHVATNEDIVKVIRKGTRLDRLEYNDTPAEENPSRLEFSPMRANKALAAAGKHYYETQGEAINAVQEALVSAGYHYWKPENESWGHIAYETNKSYNIALRDGAMLHISMYRMPSGRYELVAHVSRTGRRTSNPVSTPDSFTRAYIEAALWSSTDDDGNPLDENYSTGDISDETKEKMYADCAKFQELAGDLIDDSSKAGHDFWLTRNGHGAGFWDGDWPEPAATQLTKLARRFGEYDLYVGDNDTIYGSGGRVVNPRRKYDQDALDPVSGMPHMDLEQTSLMKGILGSQRAYYAGLEPEPWASMSNRTWYSVYDPNTGDVVNIKGGTGGWRFGSMAAAQREADKLNRKRGVRNPANPLDDAAEMYETFHGAPSKEILEVVEDYKFHSNLAVLGTAVEMDVKVRRRGLIKIRFDGTTKLCSNEAGTHLYLVDGDQSLDLKVFGIKRKRTGKHGHYTDVKDKLLLGEIHELTYRTEKAFDNFKLTDYYHGLGEDSGVRPALVYDTLNEQMEIVGGQYIVRDIGIVN